MIFKYEVKKILRKKGSLIAITILFLIAIASSVYSIYSAKWILNDGSTVKGIKAIQQAKEAKQNYKGTITDDKVKSVIHTYKKISKNSKDGSITDDRWREIQPIEDLVILIDSSFGELDDFNYFLCGTLNEEQADLFYENRVNKITDWVNTSQFANRFTDNEKRYLINSVESLKTPFEYDYVEGWIQALSDISLIVFSAMLIICIIIAPVFCGEYQCGMDSLLFCSKYGKTKVAKQKILASLLSSTILYWFTVALYTGIHFAVYGTAGGDCPLQANTLCWKSAYNLTNLQGYWVLLLVGYIGCLFMVCLTMFISSKAKSTFQAIIVPFVLLLIPQMLDTSRFPVIVEKIFNLLPNSTAQGITTFQTYYLYDIGGKVFSQCQMIIVVYLVLISLFFPLTLWSFKHHKMN